MRSSFHTKEKICRHLLKKFSLNPVFPNRIRYTYPILHSLFFISASFLGGIETIRIRRRTVSFIAPFA